MSSTVGIDLAAEPGGTAIACLDWEGGGARVADLHLPANDELVLHWMCHPDGAVGIDCPFGWPVAFVDLVSRHSRAALEPMQFLHPRWRRNFVLRETDRWVHATTGLTPLSVAADRIGHTALRLAALLSQYGGVARDGSGALCEAYPAAALRHWGLPHRGYKGKSHQGARDQLVDALLRAAPWLQLGQYEQQIRASDHALDAVVCALVARAVRTGRTTPALDVDLANIEGWIHVPRCTLEELTHD